MLQPLMVLLLSAQVAGAAPAQDDFRDALVRAEALYYEAKFKDSIALLTRVDEQLRTRSDRVPERTSAKLQMALALIGLNDTDQAKVALRELYALDPDYTIDSQQYSPKVIALAVNAKKEADDNRCRTVEENARKLSQDGNTGALVQLLGSMKPKCSALAAFEPGAADLLFKRGTDSYKKGDYAGALRDLRDSLKLSPNQDLAKEYAGLAESKLQLTADRLVLDWRQHFDARQFTEAGANYRQLSLLSNSQVLNPIQAQYRETLTSLVQSWNRACPTGNTAVMDGIRTQITELLPEPTFGADIRAQMTSCIKKSGCLATTSQLLMPRIKNRVNPEISREIRSQLREAQTPVRVKLKIDEGGNVSVTDTQSFSPMLSASVRTAVEHWKFSPIADENGPRCAEAEIVIVIERQ